MEFCISLLIDHFISYEKFSIKPTIETNWGPAHQDFSEGYYYWTPELYIFPLATVQKHLFKYIPSIYASFHWQQVNIGGKGLLSFEKAINNDENHDFVQQPLIQLFYELLHDQKHWAALFLKDCENISETYFQSIPELCGTIVENYTYSKTSHGFCSISEEMRL